jgi:5-hydroxyisourate hydrolase
MSPLTTHVLDTATGRPAVGVPVLLEREVAQDAFLELARGVTNSDGRLPGLVKEGALVAGIYRITFDIAKWESHTGAPKGFYPLAQIVFRVEHPEQHHHVPLLLSPFGYSTYRGS